MIAGFKDKGLRRFAETGDKSGIRPEHATRLAELLTLLAEARTIEDLAVPGYDLHRWHGGRKPPWSLKISGAWRLLFTWREEDGCADEIRTWQGHRGRH
jgi:proteic killer suppression protein